MPARGRGEPASLVVVRPERGNEFYADLARRLAAAAGAVVPRVVLVSAAELDAVSDELLRAARVAVVNPSECLLSGRGVERQLRAARRRVMVLAEAAGTEWYEKQFRLPVPFDAILDVGFVSQAAHHAFPDVPYRFVLNAPTRAERESLAEASPPGPRRIPWAVVGHYTPERVALVDALLRQIGPQGFVFLPRLRPVRAGSGLLGPRALRQVLQETRHYVWCSHHRFPYYESFRFRDALFAGCVPCKVDAGGGLPASGVAGIFPSVDALAETAAAGPAEALYRQARDFYLSTGLLEDHLREALAGV